MFTFVKILCFATLLATAFTVVSAAPHHQHHDDSIVDWDRLSNILETIDNQVLHSVLHSLAPKFRDGIFSKDRAAVEHVHSVNPVMASKLVYIAKRQSNGTTTAAETTATTESTSASATTTQTAAVTVAAAVSSAVSSQLTASTVPAPTTIEVAPSTASGEAAVATVTGAVVFSTIGGGLVTRTSSDIRVSFTRSTSTHLVYSTASDGVVTTSTSLIVVNAPVTATGIPTGAAGAAATASGSPGLQGAGVRQAAAGCELWSLLSAALFGTLGLVAAL